MPTAIDANRNDPSRVPVDGGVPHDGTLCHAWFTEPAVHCNVLTQPGLDHIAAHKYVPGHSTYLDTYLNPIWSYLTSLLPLWLAPNAVTTLGGLHCAVMYAVIWHHSPNFDSVVPGWTLLLCGYCTIAYYTLDCMDGKQARRTGTSSPLGQLFDHGCDCVCNLAHLSAAGGYSMSGGTKWFVGLQLILQGSFWVAQWEEYYTRILPHSTNDFFGVTEGVHGLGILNIILAFADRESLFLRPLGEVLPQPAADLLPSFLTQLEIRYAYVLGWAVTAVYLVVSSVNRVMNHLESNKVRWPVRLSALSKLLVPLITGVAPMLLPAEFLRLNARSVSVAMGLVFSIVTKKMIVFSMAKMTYSSIQPDVLPFALVCLWIRYDERLAESGGSMLMWALCAFFSIRLVVWAQGAIEDICKRLDVWCFRIKPN